MLLVDANNIKSDAVFRRISHPHQFTILDIFKHWFRCAYVSWFSKFIATAASVLKNKHQNCRPVSAVLHLEDKYITFIKKKVLQGFVRLSLSKSAIRLTDFRPEPIQYLLSFTAFTRSPFILRQVIGKRSLLNSKGYLGNCRFI